MKGNQKWKKDASLYSCKTVKDGYQIKKTLDYETTYKKEFLESDPLRDWESIDRCKNLFKWCLDKIDDDKLENMKSVLDCGTKDGQFPQWLKKKGIDALGIEIADSYVEYAKKKKRPVVKGDVCNLQFEDNSFDFVFSHHVLGLTPDYKKALDEMYRVCKVGGYVITLNDIPGNPKKHYSYIDNPKIYKDFVKDNKCKIIQNGFTQVFKPKEWIMFIEKK